MTRARTTEAGNPLIARSGDGSLIAICPSLRNSSTSPSSEFDGEGPSSIRCHDGRGSLKFTLRVPTRSSSTLADESTVEAKGRPSELLKISFASGGDGGGPTHLCGMTSSSILVWDLDRGVLSRTIDVRGGGSGYNKKKKKLSIGDDKAVLCDISTTGDCRLLGLVILPESGKYRVRVYEYDLSTAGDGMLKKVKVGSYQPVEEKGEMAGPSSFGVAISGATAVVRTGRLLRVLDMVSGKKLCKADVPDIKAKSSNIERSLTAPLVVSADGMYIATAVSNQVILFRNDKDKEDDDMNKLQTMALLVSKVDSPITHIDLSVEGDGDLALLTFQKFDGTASFFDIPTKCGAQLPEAPRIPRSQIQTNEKHVSSFIYAGFCSNDPANSLTLLFQYSKLKSGSASAAGTVLPMQSLSYRMDDGRICLEGNVMVGASLSLDNSCEGKKKRKAKNVALAPGDRGKEASLATDLTFGREKRLRMDSEVEIKGEDRVEVETEFSDKEEGAERGRSIAERLALLSSVMERTDEEEEEVEDRNNTPASGSGFKLKSATSETLTTILTQALSSNDTMRLNMVLEVTNRRIVEETVGALQRLDADRLGDGEGCAQTTGYLPLLVAHVVRRMARRHSLVMKLGIWIRAVLVATARIISVEGDADGLMAREGREMVLKLGPLKNFLNERVECFPQLLRLEGRLALLGQLGQP